MAIGSARLRACAARLRACTARLRACAARLRARAASSFFAGSTMRIQVRGGGYFLRLHTLFSIVGVTSQPHSLG